MNQRSQNRSSDELRVLSIQQDIQPNADGSILIRMGNTHVICGVSIEEKVPPFLKGTGQGWITAEYGMLPCATSSRYRRESVSGRSGRTLEIQRLIGRSLRRMVDLGELGERTLRVDCDVLNADGGTRTASITGGALALKMALEKLVTTGGLSTMPEILPIAAISVGVVDTLPLLDLDYNEDSTASADANFVMDGRGGWVEIQSTAEENAFSTGQFQEMMVLAEKGIGELFDRLWGP
ncbi:MAG: ribonuclease PH [Thermodesulfobacteriota bacterium]